MPQRVSFETARLALARLHFDGELERDAALARAARVCSTALEVERVGVWLLEPAANRLVCPNLYVRSEDRCRVGETIDLDAIPAYRDALATRKVIVANDALNAPETHELTDSYLRPLGITSMLDAPLFRDGEIVGVVCLEHVGPPRVWSDAERTFASSVADMLGMLLEQNARRVAETALRDRIADEADQHRHALIGQIALGVAHDFGHVMQGIALAVAELSRAAGAERARLQTELTKLAGSGMALVQQLRCFTRASREGDRCEARDVLVQLETMLRLLCQRTAEVRLDIDPEPVWAAISRTDLERVLFNLVLNARDAIGGFGHIGLRLHSTPEQVAIEICDDGEGIAQDLLVQVFQPYFTTKAQGTGLGLATVRTIVESAGGHIDVTSQPGHGSCFTVTLRRAEPPRGAS
jgi:two-component system cell cycle sensor histidine kinase/response regulator CckA